MTFFVFINLSLYIKGLYNEILVVFPAMFATGGADPPGTNTASFLVITCVC